MKIGLLLNPKPHSVDLKSSAITEWLKAAFCISPGNSDPYLRIGVDAGVVPADLGQTA